MPGNKPVHARPQNSMSIRQHTGFDTGSIGNDGVISHCVADLLENAGYRQGRRGDQYDVSLRHHRFQLRGKRINRSIQQRSLQCRFVTTAGYDPAAMLAGRQTTGN